MARRFISPLTVRKASQRRSNPPLHQFKNLLDRTTKLAGEFQCDDGGRHKDAALNGVHGLARHADAPRKFFLGHILFRAPHLDTVGEPVCVASHGAYSVTSNQRNAPMMAATPKKMEICALISALSPCRSPTTTSTTWVRNQYIDAEDGNAAA